MSKRTQKTANEPQATTREPAVGIVHPNAAGLDVGAEEVYACVPAGRAEERVRRFGTYTPTCTAWPSG
jgi:transposase